MQSCSNVKLCNGVSVGKCKIVMQAARVLGYVPGFVQGRGAASSVLVWRESNLPCAGRPTRPYQATKRLPPALLVLIALASSRQQAGKQPSSAQGFGSLFARCPTERSSDHHRFIQSAPCWLALWKSSRGRPAFCTMQIG